MWETWKARTDRSIAEIEYTAPQALRHTSLTTDGRVFEYNANARLQNGYLENGYEACHGAIVPNEDYVLEQW